ncbi:MAG: nuclear transport factor 2 family protein [Xenococcaceae cyanobacterium]
MLTEQEGIEFAQKWIEDWNNHDLDAIMSHYAEEVELVSPLAVKILGNPDGKVRGKTALREYFAKGLEVYPELRFDLIKTLIGVESIVMYYRKDNSLSAEFVMVNNEKLITTVKAHYISIEL